jgi:hypothetical protein
MSSYVQVFSRSTQDSIRNGENLINKPLDYHYTVIQTKPNNNIQTLLKEFIRDEKTKMPRGIIVAIRENDEIRYGYSLQNTKLDKFDKNIGLNIAINRAKSPSYDLPNTKEREDMVIAGLIRISERALKYFKDIDQDKVKFMAE